MDENVIQCLQTYILQPDCFGAVSPPERVLPYIFIYSPNELNEVFSGTIYRKKNYWHCILS